MLIYQIAVRTMSVSFNANTIGLVLDNVAVGSGTLTLNGIGISQVNGTTISQSGGGRCDTDG